MQNGKGGFSRAMKKSETTSRKHNSFKALSTQCYQLSKFFSILIPLNWTALGLKMGIQRLHDVVTVSPPYYYGVIKSWESSAPWVVTCIHSLLQDFHIFCKRKVLAFENLIHVAHVTVAIKKNDSHIVITLQATGHYLVHIVFKQKFGINEL